MCLIPLASHKSPNCGLKNVLKMPTLWSKLLRLQLQQGRGGSTQLPKDPPLNRAEGGPGLADQVGPVGPPAGGLYNAPPPLASPLHRLLLLLPVPVPSAPAAQHPFELPLLICCSQYSSSSDSTAVSKSVSNLEFASIQFWLLVQWLCHHPIKETYPQFPVGNSSIGLPQCLVAMFLPLVFQGSMPPHHQVNQSSALHKNIMQLIKAFKMPYRPQEAISYQHCVVVAWWDVCMQRLGF